MYKYNKYKFTIENGYIVGFMAVLENEDWIGQPAEIRDNNDGIELGFGCYKFTNGQIVLDRHKYNEIVAQKQREQEEAEREAEKPKAQLLYTALMTDTLLED